MADISTCKVIFVGNDKNPSQVFVRLADYLQKRGWDNVGLIVNDGKPIVREAATIEEAVRGASVVVCGMSSSKELAEIELRAAAAAVEHDVPFGFYGDVPNCFNRARSGAWFAHLANTASFYLAMSDDDAEEARNVLPNAAMFVAGNPFREDMAFPTTTRGEVRKMLGIKDEESMILIPGGKFTAGNMVLFGLAVEALWYIAEAYAENSPPFSPQAILSPHPGDRTPRAVDEESGKNMRLYDELVSFSPVPARIVSREPWDSPYVFPEAITSSGLVPGADLVIECGSSVGTEAAYQRIPVISVGSKIQTLRLAGISGSEELEIVRCGAAASVDSSAEELAKYIERLLFYQGDADFMWTRQEICYPAPERRGAALAAMADAVANVIRSREQ